MTTTPHGDKLVVVIRSLVAVASGERAPRLRKRKEQESGDRVSPSCPLLVRLADNLQWDYYSVGCANWIKQGLRCVPSSRPGTSCVVCWTCKARCDKSDGPASNRAVKNKDAGTPTKHQSPQFVNEEARKDEVGMSEMMQEVQATQKELAGTLQGIWDELRLQNNIAAMDWFSRSGMSGVGWTGEHFAEWLLRWCSEWFARVHAED